MERFCIMKNMRPRPYVLKQRAARMDDTRRRITEAIVSLHETVGPARTTVAAIAESAGVERLTVYRHFPDEVALLDACTSHWRAAHPAPDPTAWTAVADPRRRLRVALTALYAFYRRNRDMLWHSIRDRDLVPALVPHLADFDAYLRAVRDALVPGWRRSREAPAPLVAAIGHAADFRAWLSLADQGLDNEDAVSLMAAAVAAAAKAPARRPRAHRKMPA